MHEDQLAAPAAAAVEMVQHRSFQMQTCRMHADQVEGAVQAHSVLQLRQSCRKLLD